MRWFVLVCGPLLVAAVPRFDPTALMKGVLVPADAAVGSVIYRLRASDSAYDYPLLFSVDEKLTIVSVQTLNCTRFNSVCQANVVLRKRLEIGRFYDFEVTVRNQRSVTAKLECSFKATNATTPLAEIFPGAPTLLSISEIARRNTELGTILARGNPSRTKPVLLELWGSPQFGLHQRIVNERDAEATVLLLGKLDYETKTVHHLTIYANDPWTEIGNDTRNIASWPLLVAVLDEQDTPPVFTLAPPTTLLKPSLRPGDVVLSVHAEDGDRGKPRNIRYGLVSEGNPFTSFFNMSEDTGELRLLRPLSELPAASHITSPILITVVAEEVRDNPREPPAQSTTVNLALIPPGFKGGDPHFSLKEYKTKLDENSPTGTVVNLTFPEIVTQPGDVVTLELVNNNGTFDVTPSVIEGRSQFEVKVRDPTLLDYEARKSVECELVAKELGSGNFSAVAHLVVILNDVNDNKPAFSRDEWFASIPENAEKGSSVVLVQATDADEGLNGRVKYTRLIGPAAKYFDINATTGLISVLDSNGLDAETNPALEFVVEAADENGEGLKSTAKVTVKLIDINDQAPEFETKLYEFILHPDRNRFTIPAVVKAVDKDISSPNNEVHYEVVNQIDNIAIDSATGELSVKGLWTKSEVSVLTVRAWDGGVPRLWGECEVRIYPPESHTRKMIFIVPGRNPDPDYLAKQLREITGSRVTIDRIRKYTGYEPGAADVSYGTDSDRSVVEATVRYTSKDAIVDVNRIQQILDRDYHEGNQQKEHKDYTTESATIKEANSLTWILIVIIVLLLLLALILMLCCICENCPLYVPPRKRKVKSAEVQKLVIKGSGNGRQSKSVQAAEWFGRKEAWTPEAVAVNGEAESMRRHIELDRASERDAARRTLQRQQNIVQEPPRDHLYIREGNAEILRLITRGGEQQRPITLVADQPFMVDSGKDILMRRFMEQQQSEATRTQVLLPNAINKLQTEHELLENSLRQQNALLRQILIERERDLRLETQSLPAGTQTDQDACTQTEPRYLRPSRRRVRSDNDASDISDEEAQDIRAKSRRRFGGKGVKVTRRKINTPILEESESNVESFEKQQKSTSTESGRVAYKQTRTSLLRQKKIADDGRSKSSRSLRKEVLREISDSLKHSEDSNSEDEQHNKRRRSFTDEYISEDSLDDFTPRSNTILNASKLQKYHSESDLRKTSSKSVGIGSAKSQSHVDLRKKNKAGKRPSRYMDWYNKKKEQASARKQEEQKRIEKKEPVVPKVTVSKRLMADTESSARKKVEPKNKVGPEHPLLQHSEHRFEAQYPNRKLDEDDDSGIVLAKPAIAQKKSVFTIAYDDMHTSQIRPDSSTP